MNDANEVILKHSVRSISSSITINARAETVWANITNVEIEQFSDPFMFKILGIPKPMSAEIINEGKGGKRIAIFGNGKRFIQEIITWDPLKKYSFNFNPEKGFIVGHFFDISDGIFRVPRGEYILTCQGNLISLQLSTTYSLDKKVFLLFNFPVRIILKVFQKYLLTSITKNSE